MKILSAASMREVDRRAAEEYGIPGTVLMETAGIRVAEYIRSRLPHIKKVVIIAGPGNNGGDGFVTARLLLRAGLDVSLWSTVKAGAYRGDAAV
ncbi:MAG: NAD(P)H-hydrate epimerase, partial [Dethiobacteria bacterium]